MSGNTFFRFKQFVVHQDRTAMKVGTDGVLLGCLAHPVGSVQSIRSILDIGTGTGLIALMMAQRYQESEVVGIDIDEAAVNQAKENVALSDFGDRMLVEHADAMSYAPGRMFDMIVCNPPYFTESLKCPDNRRTLARHVNGLGFGELMSCASRLLVIGGTAAFICPAESAEVMRWEGEQHGLALLERVVIFTNNRKPARRVVLMMGKESKGDLTERSLTLLNDDGSMTKAYKELTSDFYLNKT